MFRNLPNATRRAISSDLRKMGMGGAAAGIIAIFNPSGSFTPIGAASLFVLGGVLWAAGLFFIMYEASTDQVEEGE